MGGVSLVGIFGLYRPARSGVWSMGGYWNGVLLGEKLFVRIRSRMSERLREHPPSLGQPRTARSRKHSRYDSLPVPYPRATVPIPL
jgi:hypothetical protein